MDFLPQTLIVFAVLIAVAIAAMVFEPANPLERWNRLVERYGTQDRPQQAQFQAQTILFGNQRGGLKPLNPYVKFDATIDEYGLWLVAMNADNPEFSSGLRVPGTHVRAAGRRRLNYVFDLYAEPPVRIAVPGEVGAAILDKSQTSAIQE